MSNGWTPDRRARQAALILTWEPWTRASGPKSEQGKAASAMNALRHGMRGRAVLEETQMLRGLIQRCREMAQEV